MAWKATNSLKFFSVLIVQRWFLALLGTMTTQSWTRPQRSSRVALPGSCHLGASKSRPVAAFGEGYPRPLAEAFSAALGSPVDASTELDAANSSSEAHAKINIMQIMGGGKVRPLSYTENGDVQDGFWNIVFVSA